VIVFSSFFFFFFFWGGGGGGGGRVLNEYNFIRNHILPTLLH
jgi:hypothetical protein